MNYEELLNEAEEAAKNAYSPYSGICVGAALLSKSGEVYKGCNIENSSYSATCCAERVAVFKAVSIGDIDFSAIAVTHTPCGTCRQVLAEFCSDLTVILRNEDGSLKIDTIDKLLPNNFKL